MEESFLVFLGTRMDCEECCIFEFIAVTLQHDLLCLDTMSDDIFAIRGIVSDIISSAISLVCLHSPTSSSLGIFGPHGSCNTSRNHLP